MEPLTQSLWVKPWSCAPTIHHFTQSPLEPLIEQEALALYARDQGMPILHAWVHNKAILLGSRDLQLPHAEEAIRALRDLGYWVMVRPFGGLAVPIDDGVLNVTLILPGEFFLEDCFLALSGLLSRALSSFGPLIVGEVAGGYCPGRYDLSVHGVKVVGIAQRRLAHVAMVSAFVNVVPVDAGDRMRSIEQYYAIAGRGLDTIPAFVPELIQTSVGNLQDFSTSHLETDAIAWVQSAICQELQEMTGSICTKTLEVPFSYRENAVHKLQTAHIWPPL